METLIKTRTLPKELRLLRLLAARMALPEKDHKRYVNLEKGYEGEILFDARAEVLAKDRLILNDLLLETNNTSFQMDSAFISQGTISLYEVKNYEGEYLYDPESDKFTSQYANNITNPLHQADRCDILLRQLLHSKGYNVPIVYKVIFINPEFTLYLPKPHKSIILPTQVNPYIRRLAATPAKLTPNDKKLANLLVSLHKEDDPYPRLPSYDFSQLKKGVGCCSCLSLDVIVNDRYCICLKCGRKEGLDEAVLRSVEEFRLLFPHIKITTNVVYEWCGGGIHKRKINRVLREKYTMAGYGRYSFYV